MRQVKLLFIQMTSGTDVAANLQQVEQALATLSTAPADMVVLPEMFAQFGANQQQALGEQERDFTGSVGRRIRDWAKEYGVWFIAGSVPAVDQQGKPNARCHVINDQGEQVAIYDKVHLFDADVSDSQGAYRESDSYAAGDQVVCFDSPWGRLGVAICYDLRFPELFRKLADQGAELVIVPAAFTYVTGQAHWQILCRARAIENGYFLAAVNQVGQHDAKRRTWGHSMLVSPWGDYEEMLDDQMTQVFSVDFSLVEQARKALPVHQHRRLKS